MFREAQPDADVQIAAEIVVVLEIRDAILAATAQTAVIETAAAEIAVHVPETREVQQTADVQATDKETKKPRIPGL